MAKALGLQAAGLWRFGWWLFGYLAAWLCGYSVICAIARGLRRKSRKVERRKAEKRETECGQTENGKPKSVEGGQTDKRIADILIFWDLEFDI